MELRHTLWERKDIQIHTRTKSKETMKAAKVREIMIVNTLVNTLVNSKPVSINPD